MPRIAAGRQPGGWAAAPGGRATPKRIFRRPRGRGIILSFRRLRFTLVVSAATAQQEGPKARQKSRPGRAAASSRRLTAFAIWRVFHHDSTLVRRGHPGRRTRLHSPRRPEEVGRRNRRPDRTRPGLLVRRIGRGIRPPVRRNGRGGHADQAQPGKAQEFLPRVVGPLGRRARRRPHLYLLQEQGRRRPDQQLGRPGHHARDPQRPVQGLHARSHAVRRAVLDGPARFADRPHRRRDHRLPVRRHQHAHDDAHGQGGV